MIVRKLNSLPQANEKMLGTRATCIIKIPCLRTTCGVAMEYAYQVGVSPDWPLKIKPIIQLTPTYEVIS